MSSPQRRSRESYRAAGRIGGLRTAALTVDRKAHTQPARAARFQKFLDGVPTEITDPAERVHRAELLRRAHMISLSQRAAAARSRAARARRRGAGSPA
jgi:hypothetical protein